MTGQELLISDIRLIEKQIEGMEDLNIKLYYKKIIELINSKKKLSGEDFEIIKRFYIDLKFFYIFELDLFNFDKKEIITLLNEEVSSEHFNSNNVFQLLTFINKEYLPEDLSNKLKEKLSSHKEYLLLFEEYLGNLSFVSDIENENKFIIKNKI